MPTCHPIRALSDNYIWTLVNPSTREAWVVDPGEAHPVEDYFSKHKLTLSGILITHHHWDHTHGIEELCFSRTIPVHGPGDILGVTHPTTPNETIRLEEISMDFEILDIPGHTLDHIAYVNDNHLFCGDTLFAGGCGRVFEGTFSQMHASLQKLKQLPDATKVFCGHEYTYANLKFALHLEPNNAKLHQRMEAVMALIKDKRVTLPSTIGLEKETNPFLRCASATDFQKIRQLKDNF